MKLSTLRIPAAWIPLAMSLTAMAIVVGHVALFGVAQEADEGPAAHLFQLLIAGQLPLVAFFAIQWLPRDRKQAFTILALQMAALVAAFAPVYYYHL